MEYWLYIFFIYIYVKKVYYIGLLILVFKYNLEDIIIWFWLEYNIMFEKNENKKKKEDFLSEMEKI